MDEGEEAVTWLQNVKRLPELAALSGGDLETKASSILRDELNRDLPRAIAMLVHSLDKDPECSARWALLGDAICEADDDLRDTLRHVAIYAYKQAIQLDDNTSVMTFVNMAQLHSGAEAVEYYKQAQKRLDSKPQSQKLYGDVAAMIAEIYMTDLCDAEDAEESILSELREGLERDPANFCCLVARCAYYNIVKDLEKAVMDAEAGYSALSRVIKYHTDADDRPPNEEPVPLPDYEAQLTLARLLVDLELLPSALAVLTFLLEQDEEDDRVWHRLALCYMLMRDFDAAEEALSAAFNLVQHSDGMVGSAVDEHGSESKVAELERLKTELQRRRGN